MPLGSSVYDLLNRNEPVHDYEHALKILSTYPKVSHSNLPLSVRHKTDVNFQGKFYLIPKNDVYKKICLNNRINSLMSKEDQLCNYYINDSGKCLVFINDKLLKTFFDLVGILDIKKYNSVSLKITSAYRSTYRNDRVGGAPQSQHLKGKALDLHIGDINKDGKANQADKVIVYDILDKEIIKDKGGLGFYPGTMIIHMDVRGSRARWNNYSR